MNFGIINNFILFGGGDLLIAIAKYLISKNYQVNVVTSERHINEKLLLEDLTFKEMLDKNSIDYFVTSNILTSKKLKKIIDINTMGLSFGAAWIFKENFINKFNGKLLNFHGSRLPRNRGGGGFSWRIMMGDRNGSALVHQITPGIDTGDIVDYKNYIFPVKCKVPIDYYVVSIQKYEIFFKNFLSKLEKKFDFKLKKQSESSSTYWPRLNTDLHSYINWNNDLISIQNFINAFDYPYKGAITYLNGKKVRLRNVSSAVANYHPYQAGLIFRVYDDRVEVAIKSGTLIINELNDNYGRNIISTIKVGDRFYTPSQKIEKALTARVIYTPKNKKIK